MAHRHTFISCVHFTANDCGKRERRWAWHLHTYREGKALHWQEFYSVDKQPKSHAREGLLESLERQAFKKERSVFEHSRPPSPLYTVKLQPYADAYNIEHT